MHRWRPLEVTVCLSKLELEPSSPSPTITELTQPERLPTSTPVHGSGPSTLSQMVSGRVLSLGQALCTGQAILDRELSSVPPPRPSTTIDRTSQLLNNLRDVFATDESSDPGSARASSFIESYVVEGGDELRWSATELVWTRGIQLVRTFSSNKPDHIKQAFFASFDIHPPTHSHSTPDGARSARAGAGADGPVASVAHASRSREGGHTFSAASSIAYSASSSSSSYASRKENPCCGRAVCFVYGDELEIHFPSGDGHLVHLPFNFKRAWPIQQGILIETCNSSVTETDPLGYPIQQPSLYSLTDRFGEPVPVALSASIPRGDRAHHDGGAEPVDQSGFQVLSVAPRSCKLPVIVARTSHTGPIVLLRYDVRAPSTPRPVESPEMIKNSPLSGPPSARPRTRGSLSQARRRHSSLGPSESLAHPAGFAPTRTPMGGTRSAPEQEPMMSRMGRGGLGPSLDPSGIQDRRLSLGRTDLNRSMDRMVLDGELDGVALARAPVQVQTEEEQEGGLMLSLISIVDRPDG